MLTVFILILAITSRSLSLRIPFRAPHVAFAGHRLAGEGLRRHGPLHIPPIFGLGPVVSHPTNTTETAWCDCSTEIENSASLDYAIKTLDSMVTSMPMDMKPRDYYFAITEPNILVFLCNSGNVTIKSPPAGVVKLIPWEVGNVCGKDTVGTVQIAPFWKAGADDTARVDWGYMTRDLGQEGDVDVCKLAEQWTSQSCRPKGV